MADAATATCWAPHGAWAGWLREGPQGAAGPAGVTALARDALGIATLIGGGPAVSAVFAERLGPAMPALPVASSRGADTLVWAGPEQWLLVSRDRPRFAETIAALSGLTALSDQSDSRAALSLSGAHIRQALAKGCMIDLHPKAFPVGATALTSIAHIGVHLWRAQDGPDGAVFEVLVARSMAGSFWSWFSASAAEFGCKVAVSPTAARG